MLLKLDPRYPELLDPETRIEDLVLLPSWGVVTTDPKTENSMKGWFGWRGDNEVWVSVFPQDINMVLENTELSDLDITTELRVHHMLSVLQKVFWHLRYRSWAIEAVSRDTGNPDWHDDMPKEVISLRDDEFFAPVKLSESISLN